MPNLDVFTARRMATRELPRYFFESIQGPNIYQFFHQSEIDYLKHIILNNKNDVKLTMMNALMSSKGFSRLAAGTNRIVYRFLDDPSFLVKVALDRVGLQDNLREFQNQRILKPFVTKIFSVTPDGLMATTERCIPVTRKEEFESIIEDVFYIIVSIIGEYVMEDIGKGFFRNWCIRPSFGPVLCDYPYLYRVDEAKLFCNKVDMKTRIRCGGQIDYDDAFNYLICTKCGKRYLAAELEDKSSNNKTITTRFGGKYPMNISIMMPDGSIYNSGISSRTFVKPKAANNKPTRIKVAIQGLSESTVAAVETSHETVAPNQVKLEAVREETENIKKIIVKDSVQLSDSAEINPEEEVQEESKEVTPVTDPIPEPVKAEEKPDIVTKGPEIKTSGGLRVSSGFIKFTGTEGEY